MKGELWKDIKGYEGEYQISNNGKVRRLKKWDVNKRAYIPHMQILKPTDNGNGYLIISLRKNTQRKNHYVHRLVAAAFVNNPYNKNYVNHLDYNKKNNDCNNLEWCTQKENIHYSIEHMKKPRKITHSNTGERYIYRTKKNRYRVCYRHKDYGRFVTIEEAIKRRDEILKGVV